MFTFKLSFVVIFTWLTHADANNCFKEYPKAYINFCTESGSKLYVGDFDGNKRDDILCHNTNSGKLEIRYSKESPFEETSWESNLNWCTEKGSRFLIADFNGDGRSDLVCHINGYKYMYATTEGHFTGINKKDTTGYCTHATSSLYAADINGDGLADLICHDTDNNFWHVPTNSNGEYTWLSFSASFYKKIDHCDGTFHLGYFNDDKKIDIMCINTVTGRKQIQLYTDRAFQLVYDTTTDWCKGAHYIARIADINGDGLSDMVCKNHDSTGPTWVAMNQQPNYFNANDHFTTFCQVTDNSKFLTGDFTGDGNDDLLCQDGVGSIHVSASSCT